jgi:hypothetical protein
LRIAPTLPLIFILRKSSKIGFIKSLARGKHMDDLKLLEFMQHALQANDVVVETLSFEQASKVISAMKL